jgi:hypothetical protein
LPEMRSALRSLRQARRLVFDPSAVPLIRALRAMDGTRLVADDGSYAFFDVVNPSEAPRATPLGTVPPRRARLFVLQASHCKAPPFRLPPPIASPPPFRDPDGVTLSNGLVRLVLAPKAGARIAEFGARAGENAASSIGLLRDAVDPQPSPSSRDYIAAYTHPMPAGTFNRPYSCSRSSDAQREQLRCAYDAPDLPAGGARFQRTVTLSNASPDVSIDERMLPWNPTSSARLVSISGFAFDRGDVLTQGAESVTIQHGPEATTLRWRASDVAQVELRRTRGAELVTLVFAVSEVRLSLRQNRP